MSQASAMQDERPGTCTQGAARSIQPSGLLLALSDDWRVEYASANVGAFLGVEAADLAGAAAATVLDDDIIHALRNRLALLREPDGIERLFACPLGSTGHSFDIAIHIAGHQVIVEAEPSTAKHFGDVTGTLRGMMASLDDNQDLPGFCTAAARQMRALTGFDRVMVTRFAANGDERVIAESARGAIGSLIGTRMPPPSIAGDEPTTVRRSSLHCVADVDATPVALVGGATDDMCVPDLSRAVLRAASPAQLDQLRTMGAQASISIALDVAGAPWGAIECHHQTPRRVDFERRALAELFTQMFAMRLESFELRIRLAERPLA